MAIIHITTCFQVLIVLLNQWSSFILFFEDNYGKEFIHFQGKCVDLNTENHVKYYHFLQQFSHVSRFECINTIIRGIERVLIVLQNVWELTGGKMK